MRLGTMFTASEAAAASTAAFYAELKGQPFSYRIVRWSAALLKGIAILLFTVGLGIVFYYLHEPERSSAPTSVGLPDLEARKLPPSRYAEIGDHLRLYPFAVRTKKGDVYYPIVSRGHAYTRELEDLLKKHKRFAQIPTAELPEKKPFEVYVRSDTIKQMSDMPDAIEVSHKLKGTIRTGRGPGGRNVIFVDQNQTPAPAFFLSPVKIGLVMAACFFPMLILGATVRWFANRFLRREYTY